MIPAVWWERGGVWHRVDGYQRHDGTATGTDACSPRDRLGAHSAQRARNAPAVPTGRVPGRVCDECAGTYRARLKAERDLVAGELAALRHAQGGAA